MKRQNSKQSDDSKSFTNIMIIVGLVIVIGGGIAWRLGSGLNADATVDQGDTDQDVDVVSDSVTINVASNGYSPSQVTVKQGQRVRMKLVTNNTYGCARSFTIPKLGITKNLQTTGEDTVEFVAQEKGSIVFQCSMRMFRGTINVI